MKSIEFEKTTSYLLVQGLLWVKAIATSVVTVIFIMLAFLFAFM